MFLMSVRLLTDLPLDGPTNMARDEALLDAVGAGEAPPTLRLYQWSPATISLGYFQKYAAYESLPPPAGDLPVVRRQTGGGAILHDRELTYSVALPLKHDLLRDGTTTLYEIAHDALIRCLGDAGMETYRGCESDGSTPTRGPFFCFARRHCLDVLAGDDKLAGSAQRISRYAVLQHGSIMFEQRYGQQPIAAIRDMLPISIDDFAERWLRAWTAMAGTEFDPGDWTESELARAAALVPKYASDAWTKKK
jgi:lipoate-protein ligase A